MIKNLMLLSLLLFALLALVPAANAQSCGPPEASCYSQVVACVPDLWCYVESSYYMAVTIDYLCQWYDPINEVWDYCSAGSGTFCGLC